MADAVLQDLHASGLFDLTGVVAVVTGGGTVSAMTMQVYLRTITHLWTAAGYRVNDHYHAARERRIGVYHRP